LISREALIKLLKDYGHSGDDDYIVEAVNTIPRITNAPAVSGEVFGYVTTSDRVMFFKQEYEAVIYKNWHFTRSPVYTTPQQPQSVADALEEAANEIIASIDSIGDQHSYNGTELSCCEHERIETVQRCEAIVRAIIKRNEVNHV